MNDFDFNHQFNQLNFVKNSNKFYSLYELEKDITFEREVNNEYYKSTQIDIFYKKLSQLNSSKNKLIFLKSSDINIGSYKNLIEFKNSIKLSKNRVKEFGISQYLNYLKEYLRYANKDAKLVKLIELFNEELLGIAIVKLYNRFENHTSVLQSKHSTIPYITIGSNTIGRKIITEEDVETIEIVKKNSSIAYYQSLIDKYILSQHFRNSYIEGGE